MAEEGDTLNDLRIRDAAPVDTAGVHDLLERAFGGDQEAQLVAHLHRDGDVLRALVAEQGGEVVGYVLFARLTADDGLAAAALAPVAVWPGRQGQGIGTRLIRAGLAACAADGVAAVFVLGSPDYYRRFGFDAGLGAHVESPYAGPNFLGLELAPGALAGIRKGARIGYPRAFRSLG